MFYVQENITVHASKEKIWRIWQDVTNWKQWDHEIEWATLQGEFKKGATGVLKPKGGPQSPFTIIECERNRRFIDVTPLPLAKLYFIHEMEETSKGTVELSHSVKITGPLSFLFARMIGKNVAKGLPDALKMLSQLAESNADL